MKKPPFVIKGNFEGLFFTLQDTPLGIFEEVPKAGDHRVRVYEGKITEPEFLDDYKPDDFRNHDSMLLTGVNNITVFPDSNSPFHNENNFNFSQVVLINPAIIKSWNHNGKTYGKIKSEFVGITSKLDNDEGNTKDQGSQNSENGFVENNNDTNTNNKNENAGGFGCFPGLWGCLSNLLTILFWLLLLFLIFWLLRNCSDNVITDFNFCDELSKMEEEKKMLDKEEEEKKKKYKEELQKKLSFFSNIYFYSSSTNIRNISEKNVQDLTEFLKKHPGLKVKLIGHTNSLSKRNLSLKRADAVKKRLTDAKIATERITTLGLEDTNLIQDKNDIKKENNLEYTLNMRVEVVISE